MSPAEAELAGVLERAPGPHTVTPLLHNTGNTVTAGIWRYAGDGWSVVRKEIGPGGEGRAHWATSEQPDHWNYWRREPLAYRSGLAASAYGGSGIRAPHLLAAYDRPGGGVALWLEDAVGEPGEQWDVAAMAGFAQALGRGQGRYLAGRRLPDDGWLSRRWIRQYVAAKPVDGSPPGDDAYGDLRPGLARLWTDRGRLLDVVEALPQTLCHLDVWPKNLIRSAGGYVLLDWSFVGIGAVGEDAGNLVPDCVWDGFLPTAVLPEMAEAVWTGYLRGLREAGWSGDERLARLGFTAGGAVKYAWLAEWSLRRLAAGDLGSYGGYSTVEPQRLLQTYAEVFRLLLDWADEARALAAEIGL